jgi:N6-L-threonylcarbamoyladenine synthase
MIVLGVETTCDETAVSIVRDGRDILSEQLATQYQHATYGGVVPEVAARAHLEILPQLYDEALKQAGCNASELQGIAVASGPGLLGALLVGVSWAKGLGRGLGIPLVGVSHLEGHVFANRLAFPELEPPFVALVVSGGHTLLAWVRDWGDYVGLGETRDDACGEAFDKVAKLLGLGYPGGPALSKAAESGRHDAIRFPRGMKSHDNYDFSYSGLKTAVALHVREQAELDSKAIADISASFQEAAVDILVSKATGACKQLNLPKLAVGGGVAANARLRELLDQAAQRHQMTCYYPPRSLCTDNATMIAATGDFYLERGACSPPWLPALARWPLWPEGKVFAWAQTAQGVDLKRL